MGRSGKWVKNIIPWKKSSKSHPSKKAAEENNALPHPQGSSKESSATSTISNVAPRTKTIEANSEVNQTRSIEASHENNISTAANQTNESCAAEFSSSKEAATEVMATETYDNLEGIIRLQALIRGHLVRRQALATLHCVRGIVKLQAVARGRIIRRSHTGLEVRLKCPLKDAEVTKTSTFSSSISASNAFASKILASSVSALPLNLQYDPDEPNSAPKWLERWSSSRFWGSAAHQKEAVNNSQLQGKKAVKAESKPSSAPRNESRKVAVTNVENNLLHSSLDNGKSKRTNRKHLAQHVETVQDDPVNELERVKKSLRKISSSNKEATGKPESVVEIPKKSTRNVSVSPAPDAKTEELHKSNSETEHVLTDSIMDESKPNDAQTQKPEMEAESESELHIEISHENGVDVEESSFVEEKVSKEEDSLQYDHKSRRNSVPAKQEYYENSPQNSRTVPSYMAATASAKAKLRGLGSPKVAEEGEEDAAIRRHSLPPSTNGKLSSMSPRIQKVSGHSNGKDRPRIDKSLTSSRDGHGKVLKPDWRR